MTLVITAHNAEGTIGRAIDSLLNQSFRELQIVVAGYACTDRTLPMCERMAERDVRIDVVSVADDDKAAARDCGVALARGKYLMFMDGDAWLSQGSLAALADSADAQQLDFALPVRSLDMYGSDGQRSSLEISPTLAALSQGDGVYDALIDLVESDVLEAVEGLLYLRERVQGRGLLFGTLSGDLEFNARYLKDAQIVGTVLDANYHFADKSSSVEFMPQMFDRCVAEQGSLDELLDDPAHSGEGRAKLVADTRFYRRVVACIENTCLAAKAPSSGERNERVRTMVNAPRTVDVVSALKPQAKELGFMYSAIARRSIPACCMSAWVSNLMRTTQRMSLRV